MTTYIYTASSLPPMGPSQGVSALTLASNLNYNNCLLVSSGGIITLPTTAQVGQDFILRVVLGSAGTLTLQAATGQTIRFDSVVSSSAGTAVTSQVGAGCTLILQSGSTVWQLCSAATGAAGAWNLNGATYPVASGGGSTNKFMALQAQIYQRSQANPYYFNMGPVASADAYWIATSAGTATAISGYYFGATGASGTVTINVYKNGTATPLSTAALSLTTGLQTFSVLGGSLSFVAGDYLTLAMNASGGTGVTVTAMASILVVA